MQRRDLLALLTSGLLGLSATESFGASASGNPTSDVSYSRPARGSTVLHVHAKAYEPAYRDGDRIAAALVERHLLGLGFKLARIGPDDYDYAFQAQLSELAQAKLAFTESRIAHAENRALALVARVACESAGPALFLRTRLITRRTEVWQSVARWDGVSRQIVFQDAKPGTVSANIQGTGTGISLELLATDCHGRALARGYGGISLPYVAGPRGASVHPVENPFSDESQIVQGITIALEPLVPR